MRRRKASGSTSRAGALTAGWRNAVRRALLEFYDRERRDLPWRRTADPYHVWVSEVMLQQTRVETVIPFYERWLDRFPSIDHLARAEPDDVMRAWEGLGYYSRARNLHRAAGIVRERYAGRVPDDPAVLRALPGVGDYTAGAIASIAYGVPVPAVDGNVRRVLCRLLDDPDPTPAHLRKTAADLVPADRAGDFNQALMELGATICTPSSPVCRRCPVAPHCRSRAAGTQLARPATKPKRAVPVIDLASAVLVRDDAVLLTRRASGLLAGLWSFPSSPLNDDGDARRGARGLARSFGLRVLSAESFGVVEHAFTHRRHRYHIVRMDVTTARGAPRTRGGDNAEYVWAPLGGLRDFALPAAQRRIARITLEQDQ